MTLRHSLAFACLIVPAAAFAQSATAPTAPTCSALSYRGLDFLVGDWRIVETANDVESRETIEAANGARIKAYRLRTPLTGWIYHLTDKPPYWVRLEYKRPDGSTQITERIDAKVERDSSPLMGGVRT